MTIKHILKSITNVANSLNQLRPQPKNVVSQTTSTVKTNDLTKHFEQRNYGDYQRARMQDLLIEHQSKVNNQHVIQTDEIKPMYPGVKTTAELNRKLLETIKAIDPQPTGIKPHKLKSGNMSPGGIAASETAAKQHSQLMKQNDLKAKFERLGEKYSMPPALIAGIASRESNMGTALKQSGIYNGWGDYAQRKGEKGASYHGFGIIQVDKKTAPLGINKTLEAAYGKTQLDPYSGEHIEWGVKSFLKKFEEARENNPKLSEANQTATAVSKYNGGIKGAAYPQNDAGTSDKDYANDTLVRARWFAQNWNKLK